MSQQTLTTSPSATVRVARWSATHPWRAIALWLVFVTTCVVVGGMIGQREISDDDTNVGQSGVAARWFDQAGFHSPDTENVLVTARGGRLDLDTARAALAAAADRMRHLPEVATVGAPATAPERSAMTLQVTLHKDADVARLQDATGAVQRDYPALRIEEVGSTSLNDAINTQVADDLSSAATFSLPVTLLILLIAFGAIVAAGVPILLALSAVASATGLAALASHLIPTASTTSSMILLMGMAVGVDYSLFYVRRARAERHRGRSQLDAVEIAAETAGHSVLVSGLAVIVAMCGLYLTADPTFASLATGSIIVVAVAVLGSLTVLPALLVKLGRAIDRPRVPVLWRLTASTREPRLWPAMLRPALRHPGRTLAISTVVLGLLALPALTMTLHSGSQQTLPNSIAEKRALDRLTDAFPDQHAEMRVLVKAPAGQSATVTARLGALADRAADTGLFLRDARPRVAASADRTIHLLTLDAPFDAESGQARDGLTRMRDTLAPAAVAAIPDAHFAVGGETASSVDSDDHLSQRLLWVIGFVVLLTMLIMGWVFRSVAMAVTTAVVNLLSAGASFGVLVLVFQHSWAESVLGFHSTGALINWIPLFTFAVLFGLSMDYHVFVVSRIKEAVDQGLSTREAIRVGITESAGTVTSAAVVMVSVFAIFAALHMVEMKEIGIGLAVAVLIDALVVRVIVLPSLMMLLGKWNWWPGRRGLTAPATTTTGTPLAKV
ncbi:MAG TPA: MMPL family transporter [Jatrophihabitans sp.]|nr:MMPL family transporter [Jatrophihabitans sp.]